MYIVPSFSLDVVGLITGDVERSHAGIVKVFVHTAVGEVVGQIVRADTVFKEKIVVGLVKHAVIVRRHAVSAVNIAPAESERGIAGGFVGEDEIPDPSGLSSRS